MKRYFIGKEEITKEEALEIEKKNHEYLDSPNMEDWKKVEFIIVINDDKKEVLNFTF